MPKKFESLGITTVVTNNKLKIEIPIKNLVKGFNLNPENHDEAKVKRGCRNEFAEFVAEAVIDSSNAETGDSLVMEMFDKAFEQMLEGDEEFIKYPSEDDEY